MFDNLKERSLLFHILAIRGVYSMLLVLFSHTYVSLVVFAAKFR